MSLNIIARLAGTLALTASLAACVDITAEIDVLSETTARSTLTMEVPDDAAKGLETVMVSMAEQMGLTPEQMKEGMAGQSFSLADDCDGEGSTTPGGGSKCVQVKEGTFAEILGEDPDGAKFEALGNGQVKVTLPIDDIKSASKEAGAEEIPPSPEMEAVFENRFFIVRIKGQEIVESNMTISSDRKSAEFKLPSKDLLKGNIEISEDLYAIVKVK